VQEINLIVGAFAFLEYNSPMPFAPEIIERSERVLMPAFADHALFQQPGRKYPFIVTMTPVMEAMEEKAKTVSLESPSWVMFNAENPDFEKLFLEARRALTKQLQMTTGGLNHFPERMEIVYQAIHQNKPTEAVVAKLQKEKKTDQSIRSKRNRKH